MSFDTIDILRICFIILLITVLTMIVYIINYYKSNNEKNENNNNKSIDIIKNDLESIKSIIHQKKINENIDMRRRVIDPIRIYDERKLFDPFVNPSSRPPASQIPTMDIASVTNIATQNMNDSYNRNGLLISEINDENKVLELMGRMLYTNYFEYYTSITIGNKIIKVNICNENNNNKEYYNGDKIYIKELDRWYTVQMDKRDMLYYNPYII
jgi:Ca2+/Na+ antiporter